MKVVDLNEWMNEALKCNDNDDNIDDDVVDDWLFIETTTDDFEVLDPITFHEYLNDEKGQKFNNA